MAYWINKLYVDESKFELISNRRRQRVWRGKNESHKRGNTKTVVKHSASVMVWGSFGANGVGNLVFIDGTMDADKYCDILRDHLLPSAAKCSLIDRFEVLQHDDPKHASTKAIAAFQELGVSLADHTANSPDLNPIEHVWDHLVRQIPVDARTSIERFKVASVEEWNKIPIKVCRKLVYSMPDRLKAIKLLKGRATKY